METSKRTVITDELRDQFRSYVEGCIPDLMDADGGNLDSCPTDYRDNIRDYAGDRACDIFPNASHEERGKLADYVADYYCGTEEEEDSTFLVSELFLDAGDGS